MGSSAPEPRPSRASESRKLVAEYEQNLQAAKEQRQSADAESERRRRIRRPAILVAIMAILVYLSVAPPGWLKPPAIPVPGPAARAAGDRFAIYLQAQRIEQYRSTTGRLPSTMEEAGEPMPGVRFDLLGDGGYLLTSLRDTSIRYSSRDSLLAFVGASPQLLGGSQP